MLPKKFTNLRTRMDTGFRVFAKNSERLSTRFYIIRFQIVPSIRRSVPAGKIRRSNTIWLIALPYLWETRGDTYDMQMWHAWHVVTHYIKIG